MTRSFCRYIKFLLFFCEILIFNQVRAQNYALTIRNQVQISDRALTFELYLLNTGSDQSLELSGIQTGILVNPAIYNNGEISVSIVPGYSQLNPEMVPTGVLWSATENTIKLTPKIPPGAGSGTLISNTSPGTRICRLQISNTVPFGRSTADLQFNFTTIPYPTKVAAYVLGVNTLLGSYSSNCYSDADNFILNDNNIIPGIVNITVTASTFQSKIYGQQDPVFVYTSSPALNGSDTFTGSLQRTAGDDAGSYSILQGTLSAGEGYKINFFPGTFRILKAPLAISADFKEKLYLEPNPSLTITYSGLISGEDTGILDYLPEIATVADQYSDAGLYEITLTGGSDNNYAYQLHNGILEIQKAAQTISFSEILNGMRVTEESPFTATSSSGLPVTVVSSDTTKVRIAENKLTVISDGQVILTARQPGDINWNPAADVTQTIQTLPTFDNIKSLFTPNGDGMNDYWSLPDLDQYGDLSVKIYNRFGNLVYESDGYKNNWDGTFNGNPLPSAAYYYIIRSSTMGNLKGVVNLVR